MNVGGEGLKYSNKFYSNVRRNFLAFDPALVQLHTLTQYPSSRIYSNTSNLQIFEKLYRHREESRSCDFIVRGAGEIMNFVFLFSLDKLHTGDWRGTASIE